MSRLGSLYIERGEPDGELAGCCETAEWAAGEIERLDAENSTMRAERNKLRSALVGLMRLNVLMLRTQRCAPSEISCGRRLSVSSERTERKSFEK
jgi:hypothetical protein